MVTSKGLLAGQKMCVSVGRGFSISCVQSGKRNTAF